MWPRHNRALAHFLCVLRSTKLTLPHYTVAYMPSIDSRRICSLPLCHQRWPMDPRPGSYTLLRCMRNWFDLALDVSHSMWCMRVYVRPMPFFSGSLCRSWCACCLSNRSLPLSRASSDGECRGTSRMCVSVRCSINTISVMHMIRATSKTEKKNCKWFSAFLHLVGSHLIFMCYCLLGNDVR